MNELLEFNLRDCGVTTEYKGLTGSYSLILTPDKAKLEFPSGSATANALAFDANTANWVVIAARKLESLNKLKRNWDYYGLPISPNSRLMTYDALKWLSQQDLPVPAVVLGSDGSVSFEWHSDGKELEIGFGENGIVEYCKIASDNVADEGESDRDIRQMLIVLAEWLKSSR